MSNITPGDRRVPRGDHRYDGERHLRPVTPLGFDKTTRKMLKSEERHHRMLRLICRVLGHQPVWKMHDQVCLRCSIVLAAR